MAEEGSGGGRAPESERRGLLSCASFFLRSVPLLSATTERFSFLLGPDKESIVQKTSTRRAEPPADDWGTCMRPPLF